MNDNQFEVTKVDPTAVRYESDRHGIRKVEVIHPDGHAELFERGDVSVLAAAERLAEAVETAVEPGKGFEHWARSYAAMKDALAEYRRLSPPIQEERA